MHVFLSISNIICIVMLGAVANRCKRWTGSKVLKMLALYRCSIKLLSVYSYLHAQLTPLFYVHDSYLKSFYQLYTGI